MKRKVIIYEVRETERLIETGKVDNFNTEFKTICTLHLNTIEKKHAKFLER
jgi:hypothetical protein